MIEAVRLKDGKLLVPRTVELDNDEGVAELVVELSPGDPDYDRWKVWIDARDKRRAEGEMD